jgi:hypothetical protein
MRTIWMMSMAKPAVTVAAQPKRITMRKRKNPLAPKVAAVALRNQGAEKLQLR